MLFSIFLSRLTPYVKEIIGNIQCGFRSTIFIDKTLRDRQTLQKRSKYTWTSH